MPLPRLFLAVFFTLLLASCARNPVVKLYDGPDRDDSQVLTVQVPMELEVFTINGKQVKAANTFFASGHKALKLAPGHYDIVAYYKKLWKQGSDSHHIVKTNPAQFTVDGRGGEQYRLVFQQPDNLEQAQALEDDFHGWTENLDSGDTVSTEPSGLILKRGFWSPITGSEVTQTDDATPSSQEQGSGNGPPATLRSNAAKPAASVSPNSNASVQEGQEQTTNYLDTLKAQWQQATAEERRAFLQWISR